MTDKPEDDDQILSDQPGPEIWDLIDPTSRGVGRPVEYTPDALWAKAYEYFQWAQKKPFVEEKVFGTGLRMNVKHPKAFTKEGLSVFLGITPRTFDRYCARSEYEFVTTAIKSVLYDRNFGAAAAGLLNANIIARQLGLAERVAQVPDVQDMTDDQINERYRELLEKEAAAREQGTVH